MNKTDFFKQLHRHITQISIGASAIRNQGDKGLIKICRDYIENKINLSEFFNSLSSEIAFQQLLNKHTLALVNSFPSTAKSFGAARKALNLFFRDLTYNKYFADKYNLPTDLQLNNYKIKNLEVPLDRYVTTGIKKYFDGNLPMWKGIKHLTPEVNHTYQTKATELANKKNIARIHLDLEFWRNERQ